MDWRTEFDKALDRTLLQSDQRAMFKLPDNQRLAVIKALEPVMARLMGPLKETR